MDLYYEVQGEGFPLVMIIGLSGNIDWWAPEPITTLARHFKVITFDNRGAGRSADPGFAFTIKTLADDTVGLMNALNIPKAHVLGISMGGMIAQELVLNYPDKVEKLVLCSTNAGGGKQVPPSQQVLAKLTADTSSMSPEDQIQLVVSLIFTEDYIKQHPEDIEMFVQQLIKAPIKPSSYKLQLQAVLQFNAGRRLKTVTKPILVVHGKKDILIPPENGSIIASLIPGAKLVLFDESGHAVFSPEPAKVNQAILAFLK